MREFYDQVFSEKNQTYSVVIEDDGRVAYAYLLKNEDIIGHVWLYNQGETPILVDWTHNENMPFLNAQEFVSRNIKPILTKNEIKIVWTDDLDADGVFLYIRDQLVAKLTINSKPGWSANVLKDGPFARLYQKKSNSL